MAPATPSPTSAPAAAADDGGKPRRPVSCLAKTIGAALDGGIFGAAIGGLMATGPAFSHGLMNGGMRFIMRSGMQSALSVGGFMATYNGGICSLEKLRARRDVVNPFAVGFGIGVAGALPGYLQPLPNAPWAFRNSRALVGGGFGSAMLCSLSAASLGLEPLTGRCSAWTHRRCTHVGAASGCSHTAAVRGSLPPRLQSLAPLRSRPPLRSRRRSRQRLRRAPRSRRRRTTASQHPKRCLWRRNPPRRPASWTGWRARPPLASSRLQPRRPSPAPRCQARPPSR